MNWIDIASIVFACVTANHLGLIGEIERITGKRLIVLNCPKCASFWLSLTYGLWGIDSFYGEFPKVLAISFLCSYLAIWLELLEGYIDTLYLKLYEKIYQSTADHKTAAGSSSSDSAGSLP